MLFLSPSFWLFIFALGALLCSNKIIYLLSNTLLIEWFWHLGITHILRGGIQGLTHVYGLGSCCPHQTWVHFQNQHENPEFTPKAQLFVWVCPFKWKYWVRHSRNRSLGFQVQSISLTKITQSSKNLFLIGAI